MVEFSTAGGSILLLLHEPVGRLAGDLRDQAIEQVPQSAGEGGCSLMIPLSILVGLSVLVPHIRECRSNILTGGESNQQSAGDEFLSGHNFSDDEKDHDSRHIRSEVENTLSHIPEGISGHDRL